MSLKDKFKEIDKLQGKINAYGIFPEEVKKKINYKFRLDWNYYSNLMEGNTLTREETRSVMIRNITVKGKPIRDVMEMRGHDEVIDKIISIGKGNLRLSESRIRKIHKAIMYEDDPDKNTLIGVWKKEPNEVINYRNEKFEFAHPSEVPDKIHTLLNETNASMDAIELKKKNAPHPVLVALRFHLDYLTIHPFYDGNGRTARILSNLLLISSGYPPFIIKDTEKQQYYQLLGDVQAYGGKPDLLFEMMTNLIVRSQQVVLDALEGKEIEDQDDIDKELSLLSKELAGENQLQQPATSENIVEAMQENIFPLFMMIEAKCERLKENFFDFDRIMNFELDSGGMKSLGVKESTWETITNNWLLKQIKPEKKRIRLFRYNYVLKGFKKTLEASDFWLTIEIFFGDYNYTLEASHLKKIKATVPYNQKFNDRQVKEIISPLLKDLIDDIRRASEKK